ncbi:MAG: hypothetical protein JSV79_06310 [Armatimonadota bacterium]|nr:MAG: hypothetical protein JSV79_06310 [Armatimonadota bacterium]
MHKLALAAVILVALAVLTLAAAAYALMAGPVGRVGPEPGPVTSQYTMPDVLRAQKLQLVTTEGKVWADMGIAPDGVRGLTIYDDQGEKRVELIVRDSRADLHLYNEGIARPPGTAAPHGGLAPSGGS